MPSTAQSFICLPERDGLRVAGLPLDEELLGLFLGRGISFLSSLKRT